MDKVDYIIDNSTFSLGKDIDGQEHTSKELQELILKMVLEFDRVCRKNNIPYALGFGSALGIYNYHGMIPWDDDIDCVFDYFDLSRLIEALKKDLSDEYTFDCYENDHRYNVLIPTIKIRHKNSFLAEKTRFTLPNRCGSENGFFLDVVAFMGVPENKEEHLKLIKYSKRRMPLYIFLDAILRIHPFKLKKKLKQFEKEMAIKYKDSKMVSQTIIIPFQNWDGVFSLSFPRDVIYPFKEYDFMGHKLYSFNNVEEFCRLRYGENGMKKFDGEKWYDPYPNEKRKTHHLKKYSLTRKK